MCSSDLFASTGKKGNAFNYLFGDVDFEQLSKDPLDILEVASRRSVELWGEDTALRRAKLIEVFGTNAVPMIEAYENYMKRSSMNAGELRKELENAEGFSAKLLSEIMDTTWGLREIAQGTRETMKQLLGDIFEPIIKPLLIATQKFMTIIINLIENHPGIVKVLGYGVGLAGLLFTVFGSLMLVTGQLMSFTGSILNTTVQLSVMGYSMKGLNKLAERGTVTVGELLKEMAWGTRENAGILRTLLGGLFKFAMITGLIYVAWRYDFLRLRTVVTDFFSNLQKAISTSRKTLEELEPEKLHGFIDTLGKKGRWDKLTGALIKIGLVIGAVMEAMESFSTEGKFRLSHETMAKLLGVSLEQVKAMDEIDEKTTLFLNNLGKILNFIESWTKFWDGFFKGAQAAFVILNAFLSLFRAIWDTLWNIAEFIGDLFNYDVNKPDLGGWELLGRAMGFILATTLAIKFGLWSWKVTLGSILVLAGKVGKWLGGGAVAGAGAAGAGAARAGLGGGAAGTGTAGSSGNVLVWDPATGTLVPRNVVETVETTAKTAGATADKVPWFERLWKGVGGFSASMQANAARWGAGQIPKASNLFEKLWYGDYSNYSKIQQMPRMSEVLPHLRPEGADLRSGAIFQDKGILGGIDSWLFGTKTFARKTGEYLGRNTKGILPAGMSKYLDDVFRGGKAGIAPTLLRGVDDIWSSIPFLTKVLAIGTSAYRAYKAPEGKKLREGIKGFTGVIGGHFGGVLGGAAAGALYGAATGSAIPVVGTIIGTLIGSIVGGILASKFGDQVADVFYRGIDGIKYGVENHLKPLGKKIADALGITAAQELKKQAEREKRYEEALMARYSAITIVLEDEQRKYRTEKAEMARHSAGYYDRHALGGIFNKPHIGLFAEDGPEAVIPLSSKYRERALGLWHGVGEIISEPKVAPPVPFKKITGTIEAPRITIPSGGGSKDISNSTQIVFKDGAIIVSVENLASQSEIKKGAEELFKEFMRLVEKENMRNYNKTRAR